MHPLKQLVARNKSGQHRGICSICSADPRVIEASMRFYQQHDQDILIEATANQVNQFGGYTGMKPREFVLYVHRIAEKLHFPQERIILGGDHLGPLTWKSEPAQAAMEKAKDLIHDFVSAGFTKIHIDTSMRLGDDSLDAPLRDDVIADRGAQLCQIAENAFAKRCKQDPHAQRPVYIIGSEVPIPGGAQEEEDHIQVTSVQSVEDTIDAYQTAFEHYNISSVWEHVIGIVVQPGVEFGDHTVHSYQRTAAQHLPATLAALPYMVFEGHSTDYQTKYKLREMVEDGIVILKVGPALTFALREALFALENIEDHIPQIHTAERSNFRHTLDAAMTADDTNWIHHYHGSEDALAFKRQFSLSDRCRYYLPIPAVQSSIQRLINNLDQIDVPIALLSQYMPIQYTRVREGRLMANPHELILDRIKQCLEEYQYATHEG